jgi:4-oxalocrotonate tautomerase
LPDTNSANDELEPDTQELFMPLVQITMLKGRTIEQKRKLVERITDAMAEEAKTPKDGVVVTIVEVEREDYARGGVLMADKK